MTEPARHLQVVDPSTGELHERCPSCEELETKLHKAESDARTWHARFRKLKQDKEAEAQQHQLFPLVRGLFDEWREATGHTQTLFTAIRFELALPYVRKTEYGPAYIRRAIAGIAYEPHTASKPLKNGSIEVYDKWENLFKNPAALERYYKRAPLPDYVEMLSVELPPWERNMACYAPDGAWLTDE